VPASLGLRCGGPQRWFYHAPYRQAPPTDMNTRVKLSELVEALEWVSTTGVESEAYVTLNSGRIWLISDLDDDDMEEAPPEDIGDESLYLPVPTKKDLDLGRILVMRFVEEQLPDEYERVKGYFGRAGAYSRFKDLLHERDQLEAWYAYEADGIEEALRAWAADNDIELIEGPEQS
jgi:hypothetical protein